MAQKVAMQLGVRMTGHQVSQWLCETLLNIGIPSFMAFKIITAFTINTSHPLSAMCTIPTSAEISDLHSC